MIATEYEYRHRFVIIALVFAFAYASYNLDHLNVVYAILPRNSDIRIQDMLARFIYGASALVAAFGAAVLTSSSTAGKGQAFNWINELERRQSNKRFVFRNFGVGGDLAYNVLERTPDVIACKPEKVVVFVGGNDVLALVSRKARQFFRIAKHLPVEPSPRWFRENLQAIAQLLKTGTSAGIGLCSLAPIGEDPSTAEPFQSELNLRVAEYSQIIKEIANLEGASYIDVYEALQAQILKSPGRAFTGFRFFPFYRDAFRTVLLRRTPDEVARVNGWQVHTDGVHLNSRGGMIVANLVQAFLDQLIAVAATAQLQSRSSSAIFTLLLWAVWWSNRWNGFSVNREVPLS